MCLHFCSLKATRYWIWKVDVTNKHDLVDSSLFPQPTTSRRLRRFDWIHIKKQNDIKRQSNQHTVNKKKNRLIMMSVLW